MKEDITRKFDQVLPDYLLTLLATAKRLLHIVIKMNIHYDNVPDFRQTQTYRLRQRAPCSFPPGSLICSSFPTFDLICPDSYVWWTHVPRTGRCRGVVLWCLVAYHHCVCGNLINLLHVWPSTLPDPSMNSHPLTLFLLPGQNSFTRSL